LKLDFIILLQLYFFSRFTDLFTLNFVTEQELQGVAKLVLLFKANS